jgi:hypothetical protein
MVAKVKSSFLKKNFQLFCYRHILSNSKSTTTTNQSSDSSTVTSFSNSAPGSPKTTSQQRHDKLKSHSTSSPSLNSKYEQKTTTTKSPQNSPNHTDPKLNYYYNNRKHLSKIIQTKKTTQSDDKPEQYINNIKPSHIPNSSSAHTLPLMPNSDSQLLADLNQNLDLLKRHQKRSKSSINFTSTEPTNSTSNNEKGGTSNTHISNPNIEIDFVNYMKKTSNLDSNEREDYSQFKQSDYSNEKPNTTSINNINNGADLKLDKMDNQTNATSQIISSLPQQMQSSTRNDVGNSLYKNNQSIANLKLAKRMQLMQKFNSENPSVNVNINKKILNGENFSKNGKNKIIF